MQIVPGAAGWKPLGTSTRTPVSRFGSQVTVGTHGSKCMHVCGWNQLTVVNLLAVKRIPLNNVRRDSISGSSLRVRGS